jgi:hypothetical protein
MIVGVTATAQADGLAQFSTTLNSIVSTDTTLVRGFVTAVSPDDFAAGALLARQRSSNDSQRWSPGTILQLDDVATRRDGHLR